MLGLSAGRSLSYYDVPRRAGRRCGIRSSPAAAPAGCAACMNGASSSSRSSSRLHQGRRSMTSTTTTATAARERRVVRVHSGLDHHRSTLLSIRQDDDDANHKQRATTTGTRSKRMDYVRGWAWQTVLLQHRLDARQQQRAPKNQDNATTIHTPPIQQPPPAAAATTDAVLLLEHDPVYTLGRGADENHLVFLNKKDGNDHGQETEEDRRKLSRRTRGPGSARLALDRAQLEQIRASWKNDGDDDDDPSNEEPKIAADVFPAARQAVDQLLQATQVSPVICPTNGAPIYRVERGGEVTYHGPGQLVVYPLLDLSSSCPTYERDLHWYLRQTEQVIIDSLADLGLGGAHRDPDNTGVWIGDGKIAAVGVTASRWITTHGFALNVRPDLAYFDAETAILPCGIAGKGVTSLAREGVTNVSVAQVAQAVLQNMERVFGVAMEEGEPLQ